jgi:hypothetical protein
LLLAEAGYFSLGCLAVLWGALVLVLGWQQRQRVRLRPASSEPWRINRREAAALLLWLGVATWDLFRPPELVAGRAPPRGGGPPGAPGGARRPGAARAARRLHPRVQTPRCRPSMRGASWRHWRN